MSAFDLSPVVRLLVVGVLLASGPLLLVYLRKGRASPLGRAHALAVVTLFLTFDLVVFGAFTRLTDSGLGCPDWPGCYGKASPLGAASEIAAAQQALPSGPVTPGKAWIEMVHRYLAMVVGVLITALVLTSWWGRRWEAGGTQVSRVWAGMAWVWVCVQGAFGALTVTMKLFPVIVTLHLLGGYLLLALLTVLVAQPQCAARPGGAIGLPAAARRWVAVLLGVVVVQAASGAWVSSNYAVLACTEFPQCQGQWWPPMDFEQGFTLWRPLGMGRDGAPVPFEALTAIHVVHRTLAVFTLALGWGVTALLWGQTAVRGPVRALLTLLCLQLLTGVSNVVLGWPLVAALLHTAGAGAMVIVLVWTLAMTRSEAARQRTAWVAQGQGI